MAAGLLVLYYCWAGEKKWLLDFSCCIIAGLVKKMAAGLLVLYYCWAGWCLPRCCWPHVDFFVGFVALLSATMLLAPFSVVYFFCDLMVLSDCSVVVSLTSSRFVARGCIQIYPNLIDISPVEVTGFCLTLDSIYRSSLILLSVLILTR